MKSAATILILMFLTSVGAAQHKRARAIPDYATIQYAGSIGFMSGGAGYNIFRNKATMSFHYGYVPENKGGKLHIAAGKLLFRTFTINISPRLTLEPMNTGVMVSYHFGSLFASSWPNHRYPEGYYWWKTSVRAHLNAQSVLKFNLEKKGIRSVSVFSDYNANELYIVSLFQNIRSLRPSEVIKIGFGVRADF